VLFTEGGGGAEKHAILFRMDLGVATTSNIQSQLHNLSSLITGVGSDFFAFIILTAIFLGFSFYFGRDRFAPLIAALYAALALYVAFPFTFSFLNGPYPHIALFAGLVLLGFIAFSGLSYFMAQQSSGIIGSLMLSAIIAGFVLAISIHVLPVQDVYTFTDATKALFASNQAYFFWLLAPLAGLFFIGR